MSRIHPLSTRGLLPLCLLALATSLAAQGGGAPPGLNREQMWFAPTAEDWKKPVGITFQRTWEDALAVSAETGKAILVCVNMDGEIASEHYAGIRYRQPEMCALYDPYVCVIASVYRHSPRDFDENGQRILCPRFGSVTCGEHIAIEPILYEQFFEGRRIAPRHIMVELDGAETYDVYYAWDTDSVFAAIRDGITSREFTPPPIVRGDRTLTERVASRDIQDRRAVETAFREGDRGLRQALLEAADENIEAVPIGLLRLAVFGFDPELSKLARGALAKTDSESAVGLISEALRVPMDEGERDALIAALSRIGQTSPRARTLAVVHQGLATRSRQIDVEGWSSAIAGGGTYSPASDWDSLESSLASSEEATGADPDDAAARLELAEATLALAVDPDTAKTLASDRRTGSSFAQLMFEDARRAALEAERLGAEGWRVDAAIALSAYYLGDRDTAFARAEAAVEGIPSGAEDWSAIATIALFAQARQRQIIDAWRAREQWPGQWLTDVNAAYSVLAKHPLGTDSHVVSHHDFLKWLNAMGPAARVLDDGLARFPESPVLHDRLRARILREKGVNGLEAVYESMLAEEDASPNLPWFAGYTSIVAAEFHRRAGRDEQAVGAYERAIAHYERSIEANPVSRESADHYVALALAGQARLALEDEEWERCLSLLLSSFERRPIAAGSLDGLGISPVDTARMLLARLAEAELLDLAARLESALAELPPETLAPPAYEEVGAGPSGPRTGRRGPGRGRPGRGG